MKRKSNVVVSGFCAMMALLLVFMPPMAFADGYPSKPITMICAYSAGGGSDLAARMVAKYTEKYLGSGYNS